MLTDPKRSVQAIPWGEGGGTWGSTRVDQETKREEETVGKSFYYGFQGKEWAKQSNEQI